MKHILTLLLALLCTVGLRAQGVHNCGTHPEDQMQGLERLVENRIAAADLGMVENQELVYIPVRFIQLLEDDGSGGERLFKKIQSLCLLNEAYEPYNIQFYLWGHDEWRNSEVNNNGSSLNTRNEVNNYLKDKYDAVNIFVLKTPVTNPGTGTITQGFYRPPNRSVGGDDYIMIRNNQLLDAQTLPHEVGHYFSLAHTFFGWEGMPPNRANPSDTFFAPADITTEIGLVVEVEKSIRIVDTTAECRTRNCDVAADKICDTRPDYLCAFDPVYTSNPDCEYEYPTADPCGDLIDPMEHNMMSYFDGCAPYEFTPDQVAAMRRDIDISIGRNYLRRNYKTPDEIDTSPFTNVPTLSTPINGDQLTYYGAVPFSWNEVPDADYYLIEFSRNSSFVGVIKSAIAAGNQILLDGFEENETYYWRLYPYKFGFYCHDQYSEIFEFTTGSDFVSGVHNLSQSFASITVQPNPVSASQHMTIAIRAKVNAQITGDIINSLGKTVHSLPAQQLFIGSNHIEVPINNLAPGAYVVRIFDGSAMSIQRFVVQ